MLTLSLSYDLTDDKMRLSEIVDLNLNLDH